VFVMRWMICLLVSCMPAAVLYSQQIVYAAVDNLVLRDRPEKKYNVFALLNRRCPLIIDTATVGYGDNKAVFKQFYHVALHYRDARDITHNIYGWVQKRYVTVHGSTPADSLTFLFRDVEPDAHPKRMNFADYPAPRYKGAEALPLPVRRVYHSGPRGGCYYLTTSGKKVYVDKSHCK
jgi:hypothetical protein